MANKKGSSLHKYTEEEIDFLRETAPGTKTSILTQMFNEKFNLNIKENNISNTLHRYNIKIGVNSGCFQKGNTPFNKGLKWDDYLSKESQEKSRKTCFSSEDRSINNSNHNEVPVGTERIEKDGYLIVKIPTKTGMSSHKYWKYKHHIVWENEYGAIPKGHNVIFADGNNRNFDINNLVLVSNAELAYMNKYKLYYKDFAEGTKAGSLIAKIHMKGKERKNAKK